MSIRILSVHAAPDPWCPCGAGSLVSIRILGDHAVPEKLKLAEHIINERCVLFMPGVTADLQTSTDSALPTGRKCSCGLMMRTKATSFVSHHRPMNNVPVNERVAKKHFSQNLVYEDHQVIGLHKVAWRL